VDRKLRAAPREGPQRAGVAGVRLECVDLACATDEAREPRRVQAPVGARVDDRVAGAGERVDRGERVPVLAALDGPREAGGEPRRGEAQSALERVGALQNPARAQVRAARRVLTLLW